MTLRFLDFEIPSEEGDAELLRRIRVNEAWARMETCLAAQNAKRLAEWNAKRALIFERDLEPSIVRQPEHREARVNVAELPAKQRRARG